MTLLRKILAWFIFCSTILLVVAIFYFYNSKKLIVSNQWVNHTHEVLFELEQILVTSIDAETGERGYIITGDENYLEPFNNSKSQIVDHLNKVKNLTADNTEQQINIKNTKNLIDELLKYLDRCIELRKLDGFKSAQTLVATGNGKRLLDEIRQQIDKAKKVEQALLIERTKATEEVANGFNFVYVLLLIIIILVFSIVYIIITINLRTLKKADAELRRFNAELEQRVTERTASLIKSEESFRRVIDNINDAIIIDDVDGKIIFANDKYLSLFKFSKDEIATLNLEDYVAPAYKAELRERHNKRVRGEHVPTRFEYQAISKEEQLFWVEVSVVSLEENGKIIGTQSFIHDVTDRKEAEEKLEQNVKLFQAMVEHTQDIISLVDVQGKVMYVSPSLEKLTGYTMKDIVGKSSVLVMHPDNVNESKEVFTKLMKNPGMSIHRTNRLLTKNGDYIDVEGTVTNLLEDKNVKAIVTNYRDVSERKRVEEKIKESEKKYRYIFENNPQPMWLIDKATLKFLQVNEAAIKHYGYSLAEFLSMSVVDIRPEEDKQRFISLDRPVNEENQYKGTWRHLKKDGSLILVDIVASEIIFEGKPVRLTLINDVTEKIKAEEKLVKSEKLYKTIASSIPGSVICLLDTDLRYSLIEGDILEKLGYSREKLLGHTMKEVLTPEIYVAVKKQMEKVLAGETVTRESNNNGYDVISRFIPLKDENNVVHTIMTVAIDITELKNAHRNIEELNQGLEQKIIDRTKALQKSNELFADLFNHNPAALTIHNAMNRKLINCNSAFLGLYKFSTKEEVINKTNDELNLQINPTQAVQIGESLKEKGFLKDIEINLQSQQGDSLWVSSSFLKIVIDNTPCILTVSLDITERKKQGVLLQKSNELFTNLFNANPGAIVISRLSDAEILNVNDSFLSMFGYDNKEEVIGKTARELNLVVFPEQREELAKLLEKSKMVKDFEIKSNTKKGNIFWVSSSLLIIDIEGDPCLFSISIDITSRKKAEEKLKAVNDELDSFTYSVSHDLRAPLRSINGFTQIVMDKYTNKLDEDAKRYMNIVIDNAKKMAQLIDDLLAFSRLGKQQLQKAKLDMTAIVNSVCAELVGQLETKKIELKINPLPIIYGDSNMIKQVIINLVANALKYSAKQEKQVIEIGSYYENQNAVYYVKDNGAGFDMKYYDKLFGVFQRLHSSKEFEGTGVGLSIAHRIISKHEGKIWAKAKEDEGATFYFSLPLNDIKN